MQSETAEHVSPESALKSHSVMIVDDEPLIRWSVRTRLEKTGFTVIEAESGRQALDRLSDDVGLALVDLRLPDTDGLTLIGRLKSRLPGCRVILVTASALPSSVLL